MNGETYDFGDGKGPVPAHQHLGGGWVADTAVVDEASRVGPGARVYGNASVYNTRVLDTARVYGEAAIYNARIRDTARVFGEAAITGGRVSGGARIHKSHHVVVCEGFRYPITVTPQNVRIGCQLKTHKEWLKVTKKDAEWMGLPPDEYPLVKAIVTAAIKSVTRKVPRR